MPETSTTLRERVAAMLAENDACGPGPVSRQEYLDDADAILRLVDSEVDRLRAEVKTQNGWAHDVMRERDRYREALDRAIELLKRWQYDQTISGGPVNETSDFLERVHYRPQRKQQHDSGEMRQEQRSE